MMPVSVQAHHSFADGIHIEEWDDVQRWRKSYDIENGVILVYDVMEKDLFEVSIALFYSENIVK